MDDILSLKEKLQNLLVKHFCSHLTIDDYNLVCHYVCRDEEHFLFSVDDVVFGLVVNPVTVCFNLCSDVFHDGYVHLAVHRFAF